MEWGMVNWYGMGIKSMEYRDARYGEVKSMEWVWRNGVGMWLNHCDVLHLNIESEFRQPHTTNQRDMEMVGVGLGSYSTNFAYAFSRRALQNSFLSLLFI